MTRLLMIVGVLVFTFVAGGCGSSNNDSSTPTSPTPAPAPAPAPAPTPAPTPAPATAELSSITMTTEQAASQTQPIGTVTPTAAAPAGGAVVRLASSNTEIGKVSASVTVAAGATTATFVVDTATVETRTTIPSRPPTRV